MHWCKHLAKRLSARDFDRQVAAFQMGVALLNGFAASCTPTKEIVDGSIQERGHSTHQPICEAAFLFRSN